MDYKEVMEKSEAELLKDLAALREEATNFRVKLRLAQAKNTHHYKEVRRDIARIMTALRQKRAN